MTPESQAHYSFRVATSEPTGSPLWLAQLWKSRDTVVSFEESATDHDVQVRTMKRLIRLLLMDDKKQGIQY